MGLTRVSLAESCENYFKDILRKNQEMIQTASNNADQNELNNLHRLLLI